MQASISTPLLFLLFLALTISAAAAAAASYAAVSPAAAAEFVRRSCKATRYPQVCEQCLISYATSVHHSPRQLAHAALVVSADRASAASSFLAHLSTRPVTTRTRKPRQAGAVKDCLDNLRDSVDRLRQSVQEMGRMGRARSPQFAWHLSNVQTWVSGALTDENTCLDSAAANAGPEVRAAIRGKVVDVAQVTSNALALVNQLGPHY